ncbi:MAG: phosphatidylserine decarboxylase [Coriobacteriales bacterium]|nr:phosphatidylserine decarboxylase [Coriobacteriales bacterium]
MKSYRRSLLATLLACVMAGALALSGCSQPAASPSATETSTTEISQNTSEAAGNASAGEETAKHSQMTLDLMDMLNDNANLKALVEKSLAKAWEVNPDPQTNPAKDLDSLYEFTDWAERCLPWNIVEGQKGVGLYEHIDQSLDAFYFLFDQPLDELANRGYYYPSLQYHEPIRSWLIEYASNWGQFLSSPDSWNDEAYKAACEDARFNMDSGWYASENVWTNFNDWFARELVDQPSSHPINKDASVVCPADSTPQGVWDIDEEGMFALNEDGVALKSARFNDIENLLGPTSAYSQSFNGGTFTHTFLDVNDYHRYHFPVSGTVVEVKKIPAQDAVGGIVVWNEKEGKYELHDQDPGWQSIETRDLVVVDTGENGLVAILPIAMSQVSSCNFEDNVVVGAHVEKGDPMGYFLFGGSDICMVFQDGVDVEYLPTENDGSYDHMLMGEAFANLSKRS